MASITLNANEFYVARGTATNVVWTDSRHSHQTAYQIEYKRDASTSWSTLAKTTSTSNSYDLNNLYASIPGDFDVLNVRVRIYYDTAFSDGTGNVTGNGYSPLCKVMFHGPQASTTAALHSHVGSTTTDYPIFTTKYGNNSTLNVRVNSSYTGVIPIVTYYHPLASNFFINSSYGLGYTSATTNTTYTKEYVYRGVLAQKTPNWHKGGTPTYYYNYCYGYLSGYKITYYNYLYYGTKYYYYAHLSHNVYSGQSTTVYYVATYSALYGYVISLSGNPNWYQYIYTYGKWQINTWFDYYSYYYNHVSYYRYGVVEPWYGGVNTSNFTYVGSYAIKSYITYKLYYWTGTYYTTGSNGYPYAARYWFGAVTANWPAILSRYSFDYRSGSPINGRFSRYTAYETRYGEFGAGYSNKANNYKAYWKGQVIRPYLAYHTVENTWWAILHYYARETAYYNRQILNWNHTQKGMTSSDVVPSYTYSYYSTYYNKISYNYTFV